jgi:hypothetical protein
MVIWYLKVVCLIILPFGIFCGHLVFESCLFNYIAIWYILWSFGIPILCHFGMLNQEKSGRKIILISLDLKMLNFGLRSFQCLNSGTFARRAYLLSSVKQIPIGRTCTCSCSRTRPTPTIATADFELHRSVFRNLGPML